MKLITKLMKATKNSVNGLRYLLEERAFLQELLLFPVLSIFLITYEASSLAKLYCVFSYLLLLIVEALNTAVEAVVDRISLEKHELSKKAKDIGSAAVFISLIHFVFAIGICILS